MKTFLRIARIAGDGMSAFFETLFSPALIVVLLLLAGCGAAVVGAFLLLGTAWALIVAAALSFLLAGIMARGMNG